MKTLTRWLRVKLKWMGRNTEGYLSSSLVKLRAKLGPHFTRNLLKAAKEPVQQLCEQAYWKELLTHARERFDQELEIAEHKRWNEPTLEQLGAVLGGIDKSTLSTADSLVNTAHPEHHRGVSTSIQNLIWMLISLERHWDALGRLPPFDALHHTFLIHAIGFAQRAINKSQRIALPLSNDANSPNPSPKELLALLMNTHPEEPLSESQREAWDMWGLGWLMVQETLDIATEDEDETH